MNFKLIYLIPITLSLGILSCEEEETESQLTNCTRVDSFNSLDDNGNTIVNEADVFLCGRDQVELDAKIANAQEEFEAAVAAAVLAREASLNAVNIPTGQPAAATGGSTLTFDEMVDFSFAVDTGANTFSNPETMITALGTPGDEPAATPDQALQVEITPSNQINDQGEDQGFYFAGTTFELDNLGLDLVDFTGGNKVIIANVYSNVPVGFRVQVSSVISETAELQTTPAPGYKQIQHSGSGWEQIEIDFTSGVTTVFGFPEELGIQGGQMQTLPLDGMYNRLQFQFEGLPSGVLSRLFVDNVVYNQEESTVVVEEPVATQSPIINFDDITTGFSPFNGAETMVVDNPNLTGSNSTASQVLQINNTVMGGFEGVASDVLESDIDFGAMSSKTITVDVFSEQEVVVDFQVKRNENEVTLEDPRGASLKVTHTGSGWETLTFNFNEGAVKSFDQDPALPAGNNFAGSGDAFVPEGQFNQVVILVDGGNPASLGAATYFVDNINFVEN